MHALRCALTSRWFEGYDPKMQFLFQTPALHLYQTLVTHVVNSQPTHTQLSSGALPPVSISLRKKSPGDTEGKGWTSPCRKRKVSPCQLCKLHQQQLQPLHQHFFCYCTWSFATIYTENPAVLRFPSPSFRPQSLPWHARTSGQHVCVLMQSVTSAAVPAKAQTLLQAVTSIPSFVWGNRKHYLTE